MPGRLSANWRLPKRSISSATKWCRGNPDLERSQIDNYDLRWEWFRRPGEVFAASVFYKEIIDPIERQFIDQEGKKITFENRESGTLLGFESKPALPSTSSSRT